MSTERDHRATITITATLMGGYPSVPVSEWAEHVSVALAESFGKGGSAARWAKFDVVSVSKEDAP